MNYYAVTALLARVYLWGNDKEAALKEAKEIIGEAGGESPASYELANSAATTSDPMFNKELIFTLDVQKLKDNSDIYFTESFSSTSNILTMSSKGKTNIFKKKAEKSGDTRCAQRPYRAIINDVAKTTGRFFIYVRPFQVGKYQAQKGQGGRRARKNLYEDRP